VPALVADDASLDVIDVLVLKVLALEDQRLSDVERTSVRQLDATTIVNQVIHLTVDEILQRGHGFTSTWTLFSR